jgi:hypothetical protein
LLDWLAEHTFQADAALHLGTALASCQLGMTLVTHTRVRGSFLLIVGVDGKPPAQL